MVPSGSLKEDLTHWLICGTSDLYPIAFSTTEHFQLWHIEARDEMSAMVHIRLQNCSDGLGNALQVAAILGPNPLTQLLLN